ncbi:MAG: iron-sulfur cluster assembly protein [Desulfobacterales bacterium]|nr:iron-sulfur cluster assembly protein [Desulfobacterales bacterium]
MTIKQKIEDALRGVIDPGTNLDIMRMKLVRDLSINRDGRVSLTFRPASPVCPLAFKLAYDIKKAVQQTQGVKEVEVKVSGYNRADELMEVLKQAGKRSGASLHEGSKSLLSPKG